ncbi:MAG: hypothetical protein J7518_09825 [Nocardioidaceae bacterium]|nr:hypothetical protein [Nocardioidaceae bacterium]
MRDCSWLLRIEDGRCTLVAGDRVESGERFFAEGAWAGPFTADGLLGSGFVCGSGAVYDGATVHVVGPSHSVEPVYAFLGAGRALVSNSLHAIVAACPEAAPPDLKSARVHAASATAGLHGYERSLYDTAAGEMRRYLFSGFSIDVGDLAVRERPRPSLDAELGSFADYRGALAGTLSALRENAAAPQRRHPFDRVVTTCSSGYDSPVCAVLAQEIGAVQALTISSGRGGAKDSGRPVAEALGLECLEFERVGSGLEKQGRLTLPEGLRGLALLKYLVRASVKYVAVRLRLWPSDRGLSFLDAAHVPATGYEDFLATVNTPEDLFFAPFEPHLRGAIVLTGFHGDKAWHPGCPSGPEIKRGDNSGSGLDEFRKRVGFVNVPVPFIGIEQNEQIARVGASAEMAPYTLGNDYDRPIARRIAEEAGVPREVFGREKSAGSVLLVKAEARRRAAFDALVAEYRTAVADRPTLVLSEG